MRTLSFFVAVTAMLFSCTPKDIKTLGTVERIDAELDKLISPDAKVEMIIDSSFSWSEGPVWIASEKMLLFSDVPNNIIYKWTEEKGKEVYLTPSGYSGEGYYSHEPGSNGLTLSTDGKLVLCQHGNRQIARMDAPLNDPKAVYTTLANLYQGKKLNSPNDVTFRSNGDFFFTDPPYGLPNQEKDSTKETPFQGVYKVSAAGQVTLLVDSITRPNGIALTPDEKTLIVANSDPDKAIWYAYDLTDADSVTNGRILYDATAAAKTEQGLPDGLRIDKQGNIFATGPGGIWIFNKDSKLIGKIKIDAKTANCALADDDKTLYTTSHMYVTRIRLRE